VSIIVSMSLDFAECDRPRLERRDSLASDQTRKIPDTDHAAHALTETSIIAARTRVRTRTSSGSTASGIDEINSAKKIHLAEVDSIMTQDGVRYRHVEIRVGDCHLQQVVLPAEALAGCP